MLVDLTRYGLIGAVGTAAHYSVMALLTATGVGTLASTQAGGFVGALVNYSLLRRAYGALPGTHLRTGSRFFVTATMSWALNGLLFWLLTSRIGLSPWPAQVVVTGLVLGFGFLLNHFWTFGTER